jgi:hypothetical protein
LNRIARFFAAKQMLSEEWVARYTTWPTAFELLLHP